MKRLLSSMVFGTVLFVAGIAGAGAADAVIGTWTMNVAKSKFDPGPPPKSMTRTYAADGDMMTLTFSATNADGSMSSGKASYKYDGKDYPYVGSKSYDMLSVKKINGTSIKSTLKKDGKPVGSAVRSVSAHGKVLTLSTKFTDPNGVAHSDVTVFDKQ